MGLALNMKSRFGLYATFCVTILGASLIAACEKVETPPVAEAVETTPDTLLSAVNTSLASMNYGEAARLAAEAQARFPGDHRLHAAAARAHARLGDAEAAAATLERGVAAGLANAGEILAEPAFDSVRGHRAFAAYRSQAIAAVRTTRERPTSHIRAGDVEIIESANGDVIRAGDIVLDTRP